MESSNGDMIWDVLIIGGGPASLGAALTADKYLDNLEADMSPVHAEQNAERAEKWETAY